MYYHNKSIEEVFEMTKTSFDGLTQEERKKRLLKDGYNELSKEKKQNNFLLFLSYFNDLIVYVLIFAGILKGFTKSYVEMTIILLVVIMNAAIGFWQEKKAQKSLDGLSSLLSTEAIINSSDNKTKTDANTLVVGDIVFIEAGNIVPADLRLIETHDLIIEESMLTGESLPVEKSEATLDTNCLISDQINMAFSGTMVQRGTATGVVVATGVSTEIGKINEELSNISEQETPLIKKMNILNKQIVRVIILGVIFLIFFGIFYNEMHYSALISAIIALIVSTIPEGLPAILSIILSLGVNRMAKENAVIKELAAVETLGSMTVICSDKTGTLTKNEMKAVSVITRNNFLDISNNKPFSPSIEEKKLIEIIKNCNETILEKGQDISTAIGNPTEAALLKFAEQYPSSNYMILDKLPFNSKIKYMATLHNIDNKNELFIKGAPDILIDFAEYELYNDNISTVSKNWWNEKASSLAKEGKRVIAISYKRHGDIDVDSPFDNMNSGIILVGLVGIIDPPKAEVIDAIRDCKDAGITVKMITGDHKETACAIGKSIGLTKIDNALEGKEIDLMNDNQLKKAVMRTDIFARTTPNHKLRIVQALQDNDEIVGMTGDGVNDAPALKSADIGVAMGIRGSQVSQEAADMVLTDDDFTTISKAIKEGRRVYDNLKKTIYFYLPTALAQGWIVISALLAGVDLPLTAVQILWLNMVSSITLSYALGFESPEKGIMKKPPRDVKENILGPYAIFRIIYVSILIMAVSYLARNTSAYLGGSTSIQETVLLQTLVISQAVYMINCREVYNFPINPSLLKNKAIWISLGVLALLQGLLIYYPLLNKLIGTAPLNLVHLLITFIASLIIFIFVEIEKLITKTILNSKIRNSGN